ncbi:MAG TPA: helix-hairpin-helix domain-containing protein [Ureibacillus sp.]|nr:helix-hairpin-helix domain-containing protein [Ureibacillus sp.]
MLFPGIVCLLLLYVYLQQDSSNEEESFTVPTIPQEQSEQVTSYSVSENDKPVIEYIMVDIKGAVISPGVYELTTEDRIVDAITKAGGYTEEAQTTAVNHAQKLQDEMVIYIPKTGEELDQNQTYEQVVSSPVTSSDTSTEKINLNSADETALTSLPGIGTSKAQAIITYREENGSFQKVEDLKNVSGIGDKTFEKLKEYIVVK